MDVKQHDDGIGDFLDAQKLDLMNLNEILKYSNEVWVALRCLISWTLLIDNVRSSSLTLRPIPGTKASMLRCMA